MTLLEKKLRQLAAAALKAADTYAADPFPRVCAKRHLSQVVASKKIWAELDEVERLANFVTDSQRFPCPTVDEYSTVFGNRQNPGTYAKMRRDLLGR